MPKELTRVSQAMSIRSSSVHAKKMKRKQKRRNPHRDHAYKMLLQANHLDEPEEAAGTFWRALDLTER